MMQPFSAWGAGPASSSSGQQMQGDFIGLLGNASSKAQEAMQQAQKYGGEHLSGGFSGVMDQAKGAFHDHGGDAALHRVHGVADHAQKMGSHGLHQIAQHVPGGEYMLHQAENLWHSDVPGGFQLGDTVDIAASTIPGVRGFMMQSMPDGTEYFVGEDFGWFDCCCFWAGKGPTYHIIEGNPMSGEEVLMLQSHKMFCCCVSPEIDVVTPEGEVIAMADEHAACCCFAQTRVDVRGKEVYRLGGNLLGALFSCFTSEHEIIDSEHNSHVGRIVHWNSGAHIQFPERALASHKAALLAAAFLTDLRRR